MKKIINHLFVSILFLLPLNLIVIDKVNAQAFIHPGGLHTTVDLERMKVQVAAGAHPWIDAWNVLIADWRAQNTNNAHPQTDLGINRQKNFEDAQVAYYNTLRWYITGDVSYANCAVAILNSWSSTVTSYTPSEPLGILPINAFAQVGEILRAYPGWAPVDFTRFQTMMRNYGPWCRQYLSTHGGLCVDYLPTSWEGTFVSAIISIGVLTDDRTVYNEGLNYFKTGAGTGSIMNAVYVIHPGGLGQTSESGRDQSHSQLGMANLASACQVAWNQGDDLYGYSSNRLLAGFEYEARYNLGYSVPYTPYNNCNNDNELYIAPSQRGFIRWPNYEMVYNHYEVLQGISAPNTKATAELMRPELGTGDLFGAGTLAYTRVASTFPPAPVPSVPTGLTATAGVSQVTLKWTLPTVANVRGYNVLRSTTSTGVYATVYSSTDYVIPEYTDLTVTNGTTYYYKVSANNKAGTSGNSVSVNALPLAATTTLPAGWAKTNIGTVAAAGTVGYAPVGNNTFIIGGSGTDIGGTADSYAYVYRSVTGDFTLTTRLLSSIWNGSGSEKVGIVMRESLTSNAIMLTLNEGELGNRYARLGTRATSGANTSWQEGNRFSWPPVWYRLQRAGNVFTAYQSGDGVTWSVIGTSTVAMASTYYAGLSACSGTSSGALTTPTFDNVVTVGGGTPAPLIADGTYKLKNRASSKYLDNLGSTADGAVVAQWTSGTSNNQRWVIKYAGGYYTLKCLTGGKYLENLGHTTDGSTAGQWTGTSATNQQWSITSPESGYYQITNRVNGKSIDNSGSTVDGANIVFWTTNPSNNQEWGLESISNSTTTASINAPEILVNSFNENGLYEQSEIFTVYPNPNSENSLGITFNNKTRSNIKITVTNIAGHTVYKENLGLKEIGQVKHQIGIASFLRGVYIVNLSSGDGTKTCKFIRN